MVAHLLRLKLTLLANLFRRSPVQLVAMVLSLLYGLGLAGVVTVGLFVLRAATPDVARVSMIAFGSLVVLGFLLLPLVFGVDDAMDPRRFSLFGIPTGRLALSIAVAALVSVPSLVVAVFAVAQIVTWSRGPIPVLIALLGAVIIVPTCVLAARVSSALAASFLASRAARDASGIVLVLLLAAVAPFIAILATVDWDSQGLPITRRIAAALAWTPLGAVWGAPGDFAIDRPGDGALKLLIAVGFLAVLWFAWRGLVAMMLTRPQREAHAKHYAGLGWLGRFPATPAGVIAARSLTYWGRDARYGVALAIIPVVPIVIFIVLLVAGVPVSVLAWLPVPVMCLFLGWTVHNDVAHDSTAFWTHVSSNTPGAADRWGRLIPALLIGVPLAVVGSVITVAMSGNWGSLSGLLGLSLCVLLVGLGVSSVMSAAFPYPAVHPGDSPFAQPQAAGTTGSVVQAVSFFAGVVAAAPVILFIILGETVSSSWHLAALGVGVGVGVVVLYGGVHWGGRIVSRQAPELLAFTAEN